MDTILLKHLGVHEKVIEALEKSSGEKIVQLEIEQGELGIKLILSYAQTAGLKPHIITLSDFPKASFAASVEEPPAEYNLAERSCYKCRDKLYCFTQAEAGQPNLSLNGQKIQLSDSLSKLLFFLAREMKKNAKGWVSIQDLRSARIIPREGYQVFSRLRNMVAGYLLKKNPRDFLEANGCKEYRLSLSPENIVFLPEPRGNEKGGEFFRYT